MLDRAAHRLEIARRLMRLDEGADVLGHIRALPAEKREHLRGLVDWVDEYEKYEQAMGSRIS